MSLDPLLTDTCTLCGAALPDSKRTGGLCEACEQAQTVAWGNDLRTLEPAAQTPSFTLPPQRDERVLESIGDFEVLGKLGQGGMGAVYRARQISLGRQIALKVLPAHFEDDEDYVGRFQREAKVAASLNHPNLVRVYASGVANGSHYIAMELVEGENLRQRLKRGALDAAEALRICADVARGLQCGWQRAQLIHRDIKPSNIYLSHAGEVKLGDLGLAKSLSENSTGLTQTGTAMGTPHYMSPEQVRGEKSLDFRADIYSLGCTLFEMLTGRPPYTGSDGMSIMNQHLNSPPPAILKALPSCPIPLARLVARMVKKSRHERPKSYEDLIAELEEVREQIESGVTNAGPSALVQAWKGVSSGASGSAVSAAAPSTPAATRGYAVYVGLGVAVVIAGAVVLWTTGGSGKPLKQRPTTTAASTPTTMPLQPTVVAAAAPTDASRAPASAAGTTTPGAATKDAPFINSLGMKFVPVPITGGPTDGKRVLFSVWETRVQDYEAFVKETGRAWETSGLAMSETLPAVNVSWEDAVAFCTWLTAREIKAGRILPTDVYRLPSDHEWSCAAGLGALEDAQEPPGPKSGRFPDRFGWGNSWPPPPDAGNFGNYAEGQPEPNDGTRVIRQRDDGFRDLAPAGSFPATAHGLYDLAGNVSEYCADLIAPNSTRRVLRGSGWGMALEHLLRVSHRSAQEPDQVARGNGFRVLLAPAPAVAALPSARATKEAPFVNSLGMKFVPVPITGGPTDGKRVLFGSWLVRVQDFEAFATETNFPWKRAVDVEQGPAHPAVNVAWADAQAFCAWLTQRERKAGKLGADEVYRLPSDHEWSCAVGIGEREDAAQLPSAKHQRISDEFPWGRVWPPPDNAANYWSEELRPMLEAGLHSWIKGELPGRRDGYVTTSPVGAFPANRFGLYDMAGNVWEWCEDWYDDKKNDRVVRGSGSWHYSERSPMLSSYRGRGVPDVRANHHGFRCVLATVPPDPAGTAARIPTSAPAVAAIPPPRATRDAPFVNSLGMKFIPVPGTGVLFCQSETRVKHYRAFAEATQHQVEEPSFVQSDDHPAVKVLWEDSTAFCAWLSKKEGREYRCRWDEEWNVAVGLAKLKVGNHGRRSQGTRGDLPSAFLQPAAGRRCRFG